MGITDEYQCWESNNLVWKEKVVLATYLTHWNLYTE